ncbi:hypothetical protein [Serratia sp. D1N4]
MIKFFIILIGFFSMISHADILIKSPNGNFLIFSKEKKGEHFDSHAWGKLAFSNKNSLLDITRSDRYYTEDGSTKTSPSGNYVIVNSISGGEVTQEDGTQKYTDKQYCSVIDMRDGCIVSDWDGEVCGYDWVDNKDILASSTAQGADTFPFLSMRPSINGVKKTFSLISDKGIENILRCDVPNTGNINNYQELLKESNGSKEVIANAIVDYLNGIKNELSVKAKAVLFSEPNVHSKTKAYLVSGDKVKVIKITPDNEWANIGYINAKGMPLVAWVKRDLIAD